MTAPRNDRHAHSGWVHQSGLEEVDTSRLHRALAPPRGQVPPKPPPGYADVPDPLAPLTADERQQLGLPPVVRPPLTNLAIWGITLGLTAIAAAIGMALAAVFGT